MSKYRDSSEPHDVSFGKLEILERLLKRKKLTEKQKRALKSILRYYYSRD